MKFTSAAASLLLLPLAALATEQASYDNTYDNASGSMDTVSCSDGPEGLASRYPTFGDLPSFPNIGGASAIAGWGSANCGTCWRLSYQGAEIVVTAIDHAANGFNIAQEALDTLTDGNAVFDGVVQVTAVQVDKSLCGL
ncbi:hypothetical protein M0805_005562 [Coniferiporia weirii]|nr:hypothetical protein M0805_005562 [Coniferiporia weirii]